MARLRRKVERDPADPDHLLSVTGVGYRFVAQREELAAPAPAVRALLPEMLGRAEALAQLVAEIRPGSLVTVNGMGGMGKSTLVAQLSGAHLPMPLRVVDADADNLDALAAAMFRAADCPPPRDSQEGLDALLDSQGPVCWVLDDADAARAILTAELPRWRALEPGSAWVLTMRAPLHLRDEFVFPLGPLDEADARALLERRAPGPVPDDGALDELLVALDGHPLTIELAAARTRTLRPRQLLERSRSWLDLLKDRAADRPTRQSSLRATLSASWDELAPMARRLWMQLAALRISVPIELVERIADAGVEALDQLVEHGLVRMHNERWRLGGMVSDFGLAQLEQAPDADELRHALHTHVLEHAEGLRRAIHGPDAACAVAELASLHPLLLALQERSADPDVVARAFLVAGPALRSRGLDPRRVMQARALAVDVLPPLRAEVLALAARLDQNRGREIVDSTLARRQAEAAIALADTHDVGAAQVSAHRTLGLMAYYGSDIEAALAHLRAARNAAVRLGELSEEAFTLGLMGTVLDLHDPTAPSVTSSTPCAARPVTTPCGRRPASAAGTPRSWTVADGWGRPTALRRGRSRRSSRSATASTPTGSA
jgi:energy-coupling factor transporter ATP-binding protein EcfA2